MKHIAIEPGLNLHLLQTKKFKTSIITVLLRRPLARTEATKNGLLAKLLGKHCAGFPSARAIAIECEEMFGAHLEAGILKKGEEQLIQLYMEVLDEGYCGEALMARAGRLLSAVLFEPLTQTRRFDSELLENEKRQLHKEILGEADDKKQYAADCCIEAMCAGEPFGILGSGYAADIEAITNEALSAHYQRVLAEAPIEIGLLGDFEEGGCIRWARSYFARGGTAQRPPGKPERVAPPKKLREIRKEADLQQGKLALGIRGEFSAVGAGFYQALLFNSILGSGASSKLFQKLREQHSLCYYIHTMLYRAKQIMMLQAGIERENYEKVMEMIRQELARMQAGDFTQEALLRAKKSMAGDFGAMQDSPQRMMDFYLSNVLCGDETVLAEVGRLIQEIDKESVLAAGKNFSLDTSYFLC